MGERGGELVGGGATEEIKREKNGFPLNGIALFFFGVLPFDRDRSMRARVQSSLCRFLEQILMTRGRVNAEPPLCEPIGTRPCTRKRIFGQWDYSFTSCTLHEIFGTTRVEIRDAPKRFRFIEVREASGND